MQKSISDLMNHKRLLQIEYESEKEEFRLQSRKISVNEKIERGLVWFPVTIGKSYYNSINQFVVEITNGRANDDEDKSSSFEYGKPVSFFSITEKRTIRYFSYKCTVSFVDGNRMVVVLPDSLALTSLQNEESLGIQMAFDETTYRVMFDAIDYAINAKDNRLAQLREVLSGQKKPQKLSFSPIPFPYLNDSQQKAVNQVLCAKDVTIVHGPPGTGKTTTLVEAIYETLKREEQVLVCAQSNMAVDWISEKLMDCGINVLRIGNPNRVNDKMLSSTYERRFESHTDYPLLWNLRKAIRQLHENGKKNGGVHDKIARLKDRALELEVRINDSIFNEVRVIASTLVGSANRLLMGRRFNTVFVDEATQAIEAATWIPLRKVNRIIMAGDYQQLPPTIKNVEAERQGLGVTLMEKVAKNHKDAVTLLTTQYRMNEKIMRFSSSHFYDGRLKADKSIANRNILYLEHPIDWIDTSCTDQTDYGLETDDNQARLFLESTTLAHSRINKDEARLTVSVLEDYINKIGRERFLNERLDVGIISPYKAQTQFIRTLIKRNSTIKPLRKSITVNTVDGFQGQERDIIILSLVRANKNGNIGFLADTRRLNVAITRAKMKLIIIGNAETLSKNKIYRELHEYVTTLHSQQP